MKSGDSRTDAVELDTLLSNTADGVCAVNGDGRIVLWNRAAEKLLGYTAREAVGRACCEVFAGRDPAGNRLCYRGCHVMSLVARQEPVHHFAMEVRSKGGKPMWLDVSILVVAGARRELTTTVHVFRDVTAAHEIEALVRERLAQVTPSPNGNGDGAGKLTRRELEVLRLLAAGNNTRALAERLQVSRATIRNHVQNIFSKLGVHSRLEAAAYATRHRLL